jgi:hypothetical protein
MIDTFVRKSKKWKDLDYNFPTEIHFLKTINKTQNSLFAKNPTYVIKNRKRITL